MSKEEEVEAPLSSEGDPEAQNEEGEPSVSPHSTTDGEESRES